MQIDEALPQLGGGSLRISRTLNFLCRGPGVIGFGNLAELDDAQQRQDGMRLRAVPVLCCGVVYTRRVVRLRSLEGLDLDARLI